MKRYLILLSLLFAAGLPGRADEGMWLVQAINRALQERMQERGLEMDPKLIYDADVSEGTLCGAIVSMDFIGTGSIISPEGLLITNHHVAHGDLVDLDLVETGFWARTREEEIRIPDKKVQILRRIIDVTDEVPAVQDSLARAGVRFGLRKLTAVMEQRHAVPGMEVAFQAMWSGEKYYIAFYQVYDDVRLVAAPPVSIASFGGDEDNWEWPQQKADFTLYRIYQDGKPLDSPWHLKVATEGLQEGDYAMVLGYPGRTQRYSCSYEVRHLMTVEWPLVVRLRGLQREIIRKWMDADPEIRHRYTEKFFSLTNTLELHEGQLLCCKRYGVVAKKLAQERELADWIAADAERKARWGSLLDDLREGYAAAEDWERQRVRFRETIIRGSTIAPVIMRMANDRAGRKESIYARGMQTADARVEQELLAHSLKEYYTGMYFIGPGQQGLREMFNDDWDALAAYLWDHPDMYGRYLLEVRMGMLNGLENLPTDEETGYRPGPAVNNNEMTELRRQYVKAMYEMCEDKGRPQYPDANSSLRLTYGRVCGLVPCDGIRASWFTTVKGIFQKADPDRHDFAVPEDYLTLLKEYKDPVNFITDLDITGGNSGSPVLNARGEVVGLAFDGNKESLASDYYFTEESVRCVCVDIRYVLFILSRYAKLDQLVAELV